MRPVLFLWIPKTAGSSIWSCLERRRKGITTQRVVPARPFRPGVTITTFQHLAIGALLNNGTITRPWLEACYRFTCVRNPWARLVSIYHHLHQGRADQQAVAHAEAPTFPAFIERVASGDIPPVGSYSMKGLSYANRQLDWLRLDRQWLPDFVARMENLDHDWPKLCRLLGIGCRLPHINRSRHEPYRAYYDAHLRTLAARHFAEEIDLFR